MLGSLEARMLGCLEAWKLGNSERWEVKDTRDIFRILNNPTSQLLNYPPSSFTAKEAWPGYPNPDKPEPNRLKYPFCF